MRIALPCLLAACVALVGGCPGTPTTAGKPRPGVGTTTPQGAFHTGHVLDVGGTPVAGLLVRGYIISDVGGGLTGIVRVPIVSTSGSGVIGNNGGRFRLDADEDPPVTATTAADGSFTLKAPAGSHLNLEAVKSDELKAFAGDVAPEAHDLTLQLAPTGTIAGVVKASAAGVTNLLGVDVFIPGSSYVAKSDQAGHYVLDHVPVGAFGLVASKAGLGQAIVRDVKVASHQTTTAPDLVLTVVPPAIAGVTPANGPVGTAVTITGDHFGADAGDVLDVKFAGTPAIKPERVDEHTIKAVVPEGAAAGSLVVTVAGIPSNDVRFPVIKTLGFKDAAVNLLKGRAKALALDVLDTDGKPVDGAVLSFAVEGAGLSVDATGKITAQAAGTGTAIARAGSLEARVPVAAFDALAAVKGFGSLGTSPIMDSVRGLVLDAQGGVWTMLNHSELGAGGHPSQKLYRLAPGAAAAVEAGPTLDGTSNAIGPDGKGNMLVVSGNKLQRVAPDGTATTMPGSGNAALTSPYVVVGDATGAVYLVDFHNVSGASPDPRPVITLFKIDAAGAVTPLAGGVMGYLDGKGAAARFYSPRGLAVDPAGNVYMADQASIRKITPDGTTSTMAGKPLDASVNASFVALPPLPEAPHDGVGTAAAFAGPMGLWADPGSAYLYVADGGSLRRVDLATGAVTTPYGSTGGFPPTTAEQELPPGAVDAFQNGVAAGSDGTLWGLGDGIARVKPVASQ